MNRYEHRRPLVRYSRPMVILIGGFITISFLYYLWLPGQETEPQPRESKVTHFPEMRFPTNPPRPVDHPHWWEPPQALPEKEHTVFLIENYNRTNVTQLQIPVGISVEEFKKLATAKIGASYEITWYSTSKSVNYLHNQVGSLDDIIKQSNKFVWTKPHELFRRVNGAFVYLWTSEQAKPAHDGNHDKSFMMMESVQSLNRFFEKYGSYPVIMFHDLSQEKRNEVEKWFNGSTIIHWVSVASHFPYRKLPSHIPLLQNMNLTGYLQMIRFRVLGTWTQEILKYFDYIQQIDTDITIVRADFDPFVKTQELDAILGFYHCEVDRTCANGLHEWIQEYAKQKGLKWRFLENVYSELVYSVNFATLNTGFFMNNPVLMQLLRDYADTGFIETRRWTEQVLYPYILALFTDYDRVYVYGSHIALTHYRNTYPPQLKCIKKMFFCCN